MLVTMEDGGYASVYNTEKDRIEGKFRLLGGRHGLRLHIYNPDTKTSYEKFVTNDKELQDRMMKMISRHYGGFINHSNTWVKPVIKRQEFWGVEKARRIVLRDLQSYFGDNVLIRGLSKRFIYYISDGGMSTTPDAIGMMFNKPLVFQGLAYAVVFDIAGLDPLSPGQNVVHFLTRPMWRGFHDRYRKIHKDFPDPTGFIASYWCQREGFGSYHQGGIRIASMTQGQSVGRWAITSLRQFWVQRQGVDIFKNFGTVYKPGQEVSKEIAKQLKVMKLYAYVEAGKAPYGYIGLYCHKCSSPLPLPYSKCPKCGKTNSTYDFATKVFCIKCGKPKTMLCDCGDKYCSASVLNGCECEEPAFKKIGLYEHKDQLNHLNEAKYYGIQVKKVKGVEHNVIT